MLGLCNDSNSFAFPYLDMTNRALQPIVYHEFTISTISFSSSNICTLLVNVVPGNFLSVRHEDLFLLSRLPTARANNTFYLIFVNTDHKDSCIPALRYK